MSSYHCHRLPKFCTYFINSKSPPVLAYGYIHWTQIFCSMSLSAPSLILLFCLLNNPQDSDFSCASSPSCLVRITFINSILLSLTDCLFQLCPKFCCSFHRNRFSTASNIFAVGLQCNLSHPWCNGTAWLDVTVQCAKSIAVLIPFMKWQLVLFPIYCSLFRHSNTSRDFTITLSIWCYQETQIILFCCCTDGSLVIRELAYSAPKTLTGLSGFKTRERRRDIVGIQGRRKITHFEKSCVDFWVLTAAMAFKTRKLCYRKDDRAMRPTYRLFYHNFVHAYVHYFVRIWFWTNLSW